MRPFSRNYGPKGHPFRFSLVDLVKLRRGGFNGAENGCHAASVLRAGRYPFSLTLLSRPFYAVPKNSHQERPHRPILTLGLIGREPSSTCKFLLPLVFLPPHQRYFWAPSNKRQLLAVDYYGGTDAPFGRTIH